MEKPIMIQIHKLTNNHTSSRRKKKKHLSLLLISSSPPYSNRPTVIHHVSIVQSTYAVKPTRSHEWASFRLFHRFIGRKKLVFGSNFLIINGPEPVRPSEPPPPPPNRAHSSASLRLKSLDRKH